MLANSVGQYEMTRNVLANSVGQYEMTCNVLANSIGQYEMTPLCACKQCRSI